MKQLFLNSGKIVTKDVPVPLIDDNSILVNLRYSFISTGTEGATIQVSSESLLKKFLSDISKYSKKITESVKDNGVPGTIGLIRGKSDQLMELGYSCSGQVIAIGSKIKKVKPGDFVACSGSGLANHAEFISVPENLVSKVSSEAFLRSASLSTIGAIAMQGVRRASLALGEIVCVIGLGLIGQITVQLAKLSGCYVIGVDLQKDRLDLAKSLGCDKVLSPQDIKDISFITSHHGVDATIITAASSTGDIINQSMDITRRKGKVVLVGDVKLDFSREEFYKKEIDFLISCSYGPGRYDNNYEHEGLDYPYAYVRWTENRNMQLFVDLIESQKLKLEPIISNEFCINDAQDAYDNLKSSLGIVFSYPQKIEHQAVKMPYVKPQATPRVYVIGAGGFAKVKLFPTLKRLGVSITGVIDTNLTNALNVAKQYGAFGGNNYKESFNNADMVVIASPHGFHTRQAIDCLKAGKAVFLEKPAAVTREDLEELKSTLNGGMFTVDFNRSFAPFNQRIKSEITNRTSPLVITYRMNAGYIPKEHWIQSDFHGGRIIGEACHVFELFCYLTDSEPVSVTVGALHPKNDNTFSTDNFSAHINFADGSVCSLLYTAIGSNNLSKERMEVFYDGKSIVMDDYKELKGYGVDVNLKSSPNKGHEVLLKAFVDAVTNDKQPPIPYDRILMATEISIIIDELASQGGGVRLC